jgi:hypothetical protein
MFHFCLRLIGFVQKQTSLFSLDYSRLRGPEQKYEEGFQTRFSKADDKGETI